MFSEATARSSKNMKCFQMQPRIWLKNKNYQLHIFFQKQLHIDIFHKQPHVPLKTWNVFRSSHTHKKYVQKQLHKFLCSLNYIYTLCVKIFIPFQWLWKHLWWLLNQKRYMSPGQCCYAISLHKPLIIVSVQDYLINRVHLVLLILKQHLFTVYCFTIKQTGLIIIKREAFRNHTLFCTFTALFLHFFAYLSTCLHLCPLGNKLCYDFSNKLVFYQAYITFLFFLMGSGLFSSCEYPLVSNLFSISFAMSLEKSSVSI